MRRFLATVGKAYFGVGGVLGAITYFRYLWGSTWGAPPQPLMSQIYLAAGVQPLAWFAAALRIILWLPEILLWCADHNGYSFVKWLAPGLSIAVVHVGS